MRNEYDFVIIGSGAGGSTVAYRLGEDPDITILVLEAGTDDLPEAVEVPWRWNELLLTETDWAYMSPPQPGLAGRQVYCASGRAIGGSSSVYHMMHVRGRKSDYDGWASGGCPGWSFDDVLPFLQKLENQVDDTNPTAGKGGPLNIINARDVGNEVSQSFVDACVELGYPLVEDHNAAEAGVGWHHVNIKDGKRAGALSSYLQPAVARGNVTLSAKSLVTRLVFEDDRCVGAEYVQDGETKTVRANREVIVCAGAIATPKLLMLSGIGNPEHLGQFDIPVVADLPGVGENFQDHPLIIGPIGLMSKPGPDPRGNMTEVGLFWKSDDSQPASDLEICLVHRAPFGEAFFANVAKRVQTGQPVAPVQELVDPKIVLTLPGLVSPLSRGWVRLTSADPAVYPEVNPNYGAEPSDIDRIVTMVKISRQIYRTQAYAKWGMQEIVPSPAVADDAALRDWVVNNCGSYYHFVGSCKMGSDDMAVVDTQLKVRGVDGLRIADASVMPTIPAANTHTSVVMIGERAADFIVNRG